MLARNCLRGLLTRTAYADCLHELLTRTAYANCLRALLTRTAYANCLRELLTRPAYANDIHGMLTAIGDLTREAYASTLRGQTARPPCGAMLTLWRLRSNAYAASGAYGQLKGPTPAKSLNPYASLTRAAYAAAYAKVSRGGVFDTALRKHSCKDTSASSGRVGWYYRRGAQVCVSLTRSAYSA